MPQAQTPAMASPKAINQKMKMLTRLPSVNFQLWVSASIGPKFRSTMSGTVMLSPRAKMTPGTMSRMKPKPTAKLMRKFAMRTETKKDPPAKRSPNEYGRPLATLSEKLAMPAVKKDDTAMVPTKDTRCSTMARTLKTTKRGNDRAGH